MSASSVFKPYLVTLPERTDKFVKALLVQMLIIAGLVGLTACNRDLLEPDPHAQPRFSTDTVTFDTVFTTIGSTTLYLKVYNKSNRPLIISSIDLAGGAASFFRLNIDGDPSTNARHVEIPPKDSLYIFVAVTVDPTNQNNPVVIKDSILFTTNGTQQNVKLIAYGQDVHLIKGEIIGTQTWTPDKPYLVYNSMAVDTNAVLTIEAGTQVYFHRHSSMLVWGQLKVQGTYENPVVFQNDRLEEMYDVIPGQWGTIYIDPISRGNVIDHAIIRNAIAGIQIGFPADTHVPELTLSNSFILNHSFAGIYAFGAEITCYNTVIANSGGPATALLRGGSYRFYHCSISNNGVQGASRTDPSVILTNFYKYAVYNESTGTYEYIMCTGDLQEAVFANSIVYGFMTHELSTLSNKTNVFNYTFDHCLLKASADSVSKNALHYHQVILNKDPKFREDNDRYHLNFALDTLSPAKDTASMELINAHPYLEYDLTGQSRIIDGKPDLGAYERKEK